MRGGRFLACFPVALFLIIGCGGPNLKTPKWPDPVAVGGKITYGDQPLSDAIVSFIPLTSTPGQGASGVTDDNGEYQLQSRWVDGKIRDGVIPGKYKVIISRMVKNDGSVWKPDANNAEGPISVGAKEEIPEMYSLPDASELVAEVGKDGGTHDFALIKKK